MKKIILLSSALLLSACSSTVHTDKPHTKELTLTVSAAASLKDAMEKIEAAYEKEHPDVDIKYNFGASGALASQIKAGAPVDLFFSAAEDKMDDLTKAQLISKKEQTVLLKNQLVIVSRKKVDSLDDLKDKRFKKIAIGTPETVPAGSYAEETLKNNKLWLPLKDKLIYTKDVRQTLTYVDSDNTDAGFVYLTDALTTHLETYKVNDNLHMPIVYPLGIIKDSKHKQAASAFYHYLQNKQSQKTFKSYGFITN